MLLLLYLMFDTFVLTYINKLIPHVVHSVPIMLFIAWWWMLVCVAGYYCHCCNMFFLYCNIYMLNDLLSLFVPKEISFFHVWNRVKRIFAWAFFFSVDPSKKKYISKNFFFHAWKKIIITLFSHLEKKLFLFQHFFSPENIHFFKFLFNTCFLCHQNN